MTDAPDTRIALQEATAWFLATLRAVPPADWNAPGLGEWNVQELSAHAGRALTTVTQYLEPAGPSVDLISASAYYAAAMELPGINDAVAQRARDAARELGDDLVQRLADDAAQTLSAVADAPTDAVCRTRVGVMRLDDFLVTRVVELVLHTQDLAWATGQPVTPPRSAAVLAAMALVSAVDDDDLPAVLMALTGRGSFPAPFSVFAR